MNYKAIFFFLGLSSLSVSFLSFLNILYSIYFDFTYDINSYFYTLTISLIIGLTLCLFSKKYEKNISISNQIVLILLIFFLLPFLISIPYYLSSYNINLINAYFESVSGFTSTGFSIIENKKNVDDPLMLWRSSSQWLGGLIFIISVLGTFGSKLIKIKPVYLISDENLSSNFYYNFYYNFIKVISIYFFSTLIIIFLYSLSGIRLLDSFHLAFTSISSGGFLPTNNLSEILNTNVKIFITSLSLLFPIFNFFILFKILKKEFKFKDHQEDIHIGILLTFLILLIYFFIIPNESFFSVCLAVISSLSTSGISTYSTNSGFSLFFIFLTFIGGSLISTSSGLKYIRFYILFKISYQEINRLVKPINIFNRNLFNSQTKINDDDSKIAFLVFILFIISIFVLSSILTLENLSFENSFKLSMLTLTNTLNSSLYGIDDLNFKSFNDFTKLSLVAFMILGKIEVVSVLFLIKKFFFKV